MIWMKADARRHEATIWARWLGKVPQMRRAFAQAIDDDPLLYNETASVGVLASAAARAGMLALAEYSATKRGDGRGRPHRHGRCDLWLCDPAAEISWAFEFKQLFCAPSPRRGTIAAALDRACADARKVHPLEADRCFGALLISAREGQALAPGAIERIEAVASGASFACKLGGGKLPVYLIMRETGC
ncbi:hypothetical protein [Sphingopyxis fribergensis]